MPPLILNLKVIFKDENWYFSFLYYFGPQSIDLSNEVIFMITYLHLTSVIDK